MNKDLIKQHLHDQADLEIMRENLTEAYVENEELISEIAELKKKNKKLIKVLNAVLTFWPDRARVHPDVKILLNKCKEALEYKSKKGI